jgi:hypothetical protein
VASNLWSNRSRVFTVLSEPANPPQPDIVTIELVDPDNMPAAVRIAWPLQPTVVDPPRFRDTAAAVVKMFSEAHITLVRIKAARRRL